MLLVCLHVCLNQNERVCLYVCVCACVCFVFVRAPACKVWPAIVSPANPCLGQIVYACARVWACFDWLANEFLLFGHSWPIVECWRYRHVVRLQHLLYICSGQEICGSRLDPPVDPDPQEFHGAADPSLLNTGGCVFSDDLNNWHHFVNFYSWPWEFGHTGDLPLRIYRPICPHN